MSQLPVAVALGLLLAAAPPATPPEEPPKDKPPGERIEKIDPSADRSLTGVVEAVQPKDENNDKVTMHTSGTPDDPLYRYVFLIEEGKTKLLGADGESLTDGLKSRLLDGAKVRVTFVDRLPGNDAAPPAGMHFARTVQIIALGK